MPNASKQIEIGTTVAQREEDGAEVVSLVQFAIEQKVPVEMLERLVALQERVTDKAARAAFFGALKDFQAECPVIPKSHTANVKTKSGASFRYTYADLGDIVETVRPLLHKHGLSYAWNSKVTENRLLCTCKLRHVEGHQEEAEFECPVESEAGMSPAQKNGAALTYARRQSLVQVLGITTADEDTDGRAPASTEKITDSQAADLKSLADEVKADVSKFLLHLKVPDLESIPASRYSEAVRLLERKRRRAG